MNKTIEDIISRRSIKKYNSKPVSLEDLQTIVKAGEYAPSGRNKQSAIMLVVQNEELLEKLRRLNQTSVGQPYTGDNFYGAKTVIVVLADKNVATHVYDGSLVMANLMLAAHSLGISSCWIHRAKETFETAEGKQILKDLHIEGDYEGIGNCILGYTDQIVSAKDRKEKYARYIL
ncbi:MAG: nitroreductase [Erysipelotrichia bacterium]|nr:nitroreductase [Erysipelotrichia bacterium]